MSNEIRTPDWGISDDDDDDDKEEEDLAVRPPSKRARFVTDDNNSGDEDDDDPRANAVVITNAVHINTLFGHGDTAGTAPAEKTLDAADAASAEDDDGGDAYAAEPVFKPDTIAAHKEQHDSYCFLCNLHVLEAVGLEDSRAAQCAVDFRDHIARVFDAFAKMHHSNGRYALLADAVLDAYETHVLHNPTLAAGGGRAVQPWSRESIMYHMKFLWEKDALLLSVRRDLERVDALLEHVYTQTLHRVRGAQAPALPQPEIDTRMTREYRELLKSKTLLLATERQLQQQAKSD